MSGWLEEVVLGIKEAHRSVQWDATFNKSSICFYALELSHYTYKISSGSSCSLNCVSRKPESWMIKTVRDLEKIDPCDLPPPFQHLLPSPGPSLQSLSPAPSVPGSGLRLDAAPSELTFPLGQPAPWRDMGHFSDEGGTSLYPVRCCAVSLFSSCKLWAAFPSISTCPIGT